MPHPAIVETYLKLPVQKTTEFWDTQRIQHIRALAATGKGIQEWNFPEERSNRVLDRVSFRRDGRGIADADTRCSLAYGRIAMDAPYYLGDMSFGALSGIPNVALARAADITGVLTGTGEGGLHDEVRKCKRITVQWASARFGVDLDILNAGLGVVIKIGQGAKPGLGGHLPGVKVTPAISKARRIPQGIDAISPAPHHDIYSIEDLEQRIRGLKLATGKPVFVKVGVTNYIAYIASGIARMGADGIIMDGHGAGTGAAPMIVRDHVGIPVELAVPAVDWMLREEGLREGFSIIASGQVSNAEDTAKLLALGADAVSLGTAGLISMGCVMVHKCQVGFCPAILTNRTDSEYPRILSLEKSVERVVNLVKGWNEELMGIMERIGVGGIDELVGRRDLLFGHRMNEETLRVLGIDGDADRGPATLGGTPWQERRMGYIRELSAKGDPVMTSMGSPAPPFFEEPQRISDWIRCDGAQVTRPSIDPYREEVETAVDLPWGTRLSFPVALGIDGSLLPEIQEILLAAAKSCGLLAIASGLHGVGGLSRYAHRILTDELPPPGGYGGYVVPYRGPRDFEAAVEQAPEGPVLALLGSDEGSIDIAAELIGRVDGLILDEELFDRHPLPLEIAVSEVDQKLKLEPGARHRACVVAQANGLRGSDDVYKLVGLGADVVSLRQAPLVAMGLRGEGPVDLRLARRGLERFLIGIKKELKLLAGAAGVSNLQCTLAGNRELFRTVDLEPGVRRRLNVKPAGM